MQEDTLLPKTPTSLSSWVRLIVQAINSEGLDSTAIFTNSGINIDDLKKPYARISTESIKKVWDSVIELSGNPYFSLKVASQFKPTVFSALGMSLAASRHVYDVIIRANKYSQMISDGSNTEILEHGSELLFSIKPRPPLLRPDNQYGTEALFACMHNIFKSVAGDDFHPKSVTFMHDCPHDPDPYTDYFNCPVLFNQSSNSLIFDKETLFQEQAFSNSQLTSTLDHWIEEHLNSFKENLVSTKVKQFILKRLPSEKIDQEVVANSLAISTRVLQRRLKEEGTSYSELLDGCRHILAIKLINQVNLPLSEITYMLGFSDQSNFSRAFKRWTGTTPHHYKDS